MQKTKQNNINLTKLSNQINLFDQTNSSDKTNSSDFDSVKSLDLMNSNIQYPLMINTKNTMPLFNGQKSNEIIHKEKIQKEINSSDNNFKYNRHLPTLLFFYDPGCPACIQTKPHWTNVKLKLESKFKETGILFNIIEQNLTDKTTEKLTKLFDIEYIPTIIMINSSDRTINKIERIEGLADSKRILNFIKESYDKFIN